jgi:hypothetical protein
MKGLRQEFKNAFLNLTVVCGTKVLPFAVVSKIDNYVILCYLQNFDSWKLW